MKQAQNAIVEFLLVNHPLDCPVCDKGGECPLQDISFGWGAGRSRFIEPKRHFGKPLELSPLVAIDRERCILCYRCVRFSQEVAEDYQLVFLERGDHTFVGTHDGHPYVAPFSGNIMELCPVGALTSTAYRFRARPWDIEDSGSVCTLCPSQCNVKFTTRDDTKVLRVLARDNKEVDDGWLCDKGRFGYQIVHAVSDHAADGARRRRAARRSRGSARSTTAAAALERRARAPPRSWAARRPTRRASSFSTCCARCSARPTWTRAPAARLDPEQARVLARPDFRRAVPDIDYADAVLVVDTELGGRGADPRPARAQGRAPQRGQTWWWRPAGRSSLDPNADAVAALRAGRRRGRAGGARRGARAARATSTTSPPARAPSADAVRAAAELLRGGGGDS